MNTKSIAAALATALLLATTGIASAQSAIADGYVAISPNVPFTTEATDRSRSAPTAGHGRVSTVRPYDTSGGASDPYVSPPWLDY
jgi:hypothetical protein